MTFFNKVKHISGTKHKHRLIIPIDQGLVTPDVQVRTFLQSRSDLTSKNGLENPIFLGCTLRLSDAHHIYLVNHFIKNES